MAEKNDLEKAHAAKVEAKKRKPSFVAQDSHKKRELRSHGENLMDQIVR